MQLNNTACTPPTCQPPSYLTFLCFLRASLPPHPKNPQRLKTYFPIFLSDFPIELRQYPRGAEMPWHLDEQMYASPQWELIYTIDNSSDSRYDGAGMWWIGVGGGDGGGMWWCSVVVDWSVVRPV